MRSYIDQILINGEKVIHRARLSLWSLLWLIVLGIVTLPLVGLGLYFLVKAWLVYRTTELAITNKRIISKAGIISRAVMELRLDKIESIQVEQGLLGRMLNFGSIMIAGTGGDKTPIESIAEPLLFQKYFMSAVDAGAK